jgi:type VI protein secretion system component Hcp
MAIYMKLTEIKGPSEVQSFPDQIQLTSFSFSSQRTIGQPAGTDKNRGKSEAFIHEINVSKPWDGVSSSKLFESLAKGVMNMTATISFSNADSPPVTYLEVCLSNVAITQYSVGGGGDGGLPQESLTLSYTAIQWTPSTIASDAKAKSGAKVKYDLTTGKLL